MDLTEEDVRRVGRSELALEGLALGGADAAEQPGAGIDFKLSQWGSLAYFAGIAVALLVVALIVAKRRDA